MTWIKGNISYIFSLLVSLKKHIIVILSPIWKSNEEIVLAVLDVWELNEHNAAVPFLVHLNTITIFRRYSHEK